MDPKYKYNALSTTSTTKSSLDDIEDIEYEKNEHDHYWISRSQGQLGHWIAHAVNLVIILGLLVLLVHSNRSSRIAGLSWDMYNYYCTLPSFFVLRENSLTQCSPC